jgi:hypothetical protein
MRAPVMHVVLVVGIASVSACSEAGYVVEKETNRPLEGVVIVKAKRGSVYGGAGGNAQQCFHLAYGRSDVQGKFSVPRGLSSAGYIELAYKPGYHEVETSGDEERIVMARNSDVPRVRFEEILKTANQVPFDCPRNQVEQLFDLVSLPAYRELAPLVETESQFYKADAILGATETMMLGQEAAETRASARSAEWRQKKGGAR